MAVSGNKMKVSAVVKWPKVIWKSERELECGKKVCVMDVMRKKKKWARVLTNCLFFICGFSIDKE